MKIQLLVPSQLGFLAVFAATLLSHPIAATASVKVIGDWRMGENDAGAANGIPVTNSIDNIGAHNLTFTANSTYSTNVAVRANSSLSISLTNQSYALAASVVTNATDHFGMEIWVDPMAVNGTSQVIAYNGNTGNSGWGIFINSDNTFSGLYGGHAVVTGTPAQAGVWTDVALVCDSPNTVLYINGVPVATNSATGPAAPAGVFGIGAPPQNPTGQFFTGLVDEVQVFTFAAGQFTTNDLLVNEALPSAQAGTASGNSPTIRVLNGNVVPNGADTTARFLWGTTTNYGQTSGLIFVSGTNNSASVSNFIFGLSPGTIYHYALSVSNIIGTNISQDSTFVTGGFAMVSNGLPNLAGGSVAWGDYDNDGHLDILITGVTNSGKGFGVAQIWHNNGTGTFSQIDPGLPTLKNSTAAWGDYDNDGRLDILLCGSDTNNQPLTQLWHANPSGLFFSNNISANIAGVASGSVAWGDYNNDGYLDAMVVGQGTPGTGTKEVWRNNGDGTFSDAVRLSTFQIPLVWVDYDNDGRLDISDGNQLLHQNQNGTFTGATNITGLESMAWGDYDNDGWPDILVAGRINVTTFTQIWHNNGNGTFTAIDAGLPGVDNSAVAWGDFDNDGRLDILITGTTNGSTSGGIIQFWRNNGNGTFSYVAGTGLTGISSASVACGDYDNDGRLDILISGVDTNGLPATQLWQNQMVAANTLPQPPSGLVAHVSGTNVVFQWNPGSDLETPTAALTYNLRIGSSSGGVNILSPMSTASGFRRIPQGGNAGTLTNKIFLPANGTYYWSVQTIDNEFGGSSFAPEQSFKLLPAMAPINVTNPVPGDVNGDGVVDGAEVITVLSHLATNGTIGPGSLNLALQNYLGTYPLTFSNVAGMGSSNIVFNLPGFPNANLSVQSSTDLVNWQTLGPVYYGFTDTNAPTNAQRFYRLSYP